MGAGVAEGGLFAGAGAVKGCSTTTVGLSVLVLWLGCAALAYAASNAYWWREFPTLQSEPGRREDIRSRSIFYAALGPVSVVCMAVTGVYRHGLLWRIP